MNQRRLIVLSFLTSCFAIIMMQCANETKKDVRGAAYADAESCMKCHSDIVSHYEQNAHFHTSTIVDGQHPIAAFDLPQDTFIFNEGTKVGIESRQGGLYQVAYVQGKEMKAEKIDLVFGAGKSAYTFAFWYGNKLMQHPLNYLIEAHQWVNSPGFPTDQIYFGRPIIAKCIECHGSFVNKQLIRTGSLQMEEQFVKGSLLPGIDCQRCHGPSAAHVAFHETHPEVKEPHEITPYISLSRSQRVDMCAICHSGGSNSLSLTSNFFFKPGDTMRNLPEYSTFRGEDADVHGKQKQLMLASKCYQLSNMDCQSCHSIHGEDKADLAIYSQKCIQCHQQVEHPGLSLSEKSVLSKNCIDCHMPIKSSTLIGFQKSNSKDKFPYQVRTHHIAIYQQTTAPKP